MSPHKKTTAKKPLKRQGYEEDRFRDRDAFEEFSEYYKDAIIIVEREADLRSLESTFIPDVFRDRTWAPLLTSSMDVHHILLREFLLNDRIALKLRKKNKNTKITINPKK